MSVLLTQARSPSDESTPVKSIRQVVASVGSAGLNENRQLRVELPGGLYVPAAQPMPSAAKVKALTKSWRASRVPTNVVAAVLVLMR
jgi:hypothetical protein